ncbi:TonB family protein [Duganella sp. FT134W]|uniref:TonB family protein n=1 Tax=Duganella margarita TaxID=2692170 RepID=A0A7X4H0Y5_9BURK|nr:TonB family protein [Duganella margarita]MYM72875.1 TonB family protein [Duganella margarita]
MTKYLAASLAAFSLVTTALAQTPAANRAVAEFSTCVKPEWPKESLRKEQQGTVQLAFLIGADGGVRDTRVVRSSGYPLLDSAAKDSLAKCKFKPAIHDGQAVESWTQMQYVWRLEGRSPQQMAAALATAREGAERGDAAAQYKLGMIYLNGQGIKQDRDEASKWLQKAAEQGSADAQEALGLINAPRPNYGGDPSQAIAWFRLAAAQGKAQSQFFLAMLLTKQGQNDEGREWLRKAAAQNYAPAETMLGSQLLGTGKEEDRPEAIALLTKAAAQNELLAQVALGTCYEKGLGVTQDYAQAATLYQRAALANNSNALLALARLYDNGQGVPKDAAKAEQLRSQAITLQ